MDPRRRPGPLGSKGFPRVLRGTGSPQAMNSLWKALDPRTSQPVGCPSINLWRACEKGVKRLGSKNLSHTPWGNLDREAIRQTTPVFPVDRL